MNTPTTLSPICANIQPFWGPDAYHMGDSGIPKAADLVSWWNLGLRALRVVVPSEAFFADPGACWTFMAPSLAVIRKSGFTTVELSLFSDQRSGYEHVRLVQTAAGRKAYAQGAAELVARGGGGYSYDLAAEMKLEDPNSYGDDVADELSAVIYAWATKVNKAVRLVFDMPMYASPDQAKGVQFFAPGCKLGVDWFPDEPSGDYMQIALDPAETYDQLVARYRLQLAPALALSKETGCPLKIQQCGGVDLMKRNDWMTSRVLLATKQVLSENGLAASAAWWQLPGYVSGAKAIALAPTAVPATA